MKFALAPFIGKGILGNEYRPPVDDFGSIDLRADPTRQEGWCLVAAHSLPRGGIDLGDDLDEPLATSTRRHLESNLRINLEASRLREAIVHLLLRHATLPWDKTRWNRLIVNHQGRYRIVLGPELIYDAPAIRAVVTDDFNRANEALETSVNWDAIYSSGGFSVATNELETNTGTGRSVGWWVSPTFGPNCYVQVDHLVLATQAGGIMVRYDGQGPTGDGDFYFGRDIVSSYDIGKVVGGSFTQLVTGGTPATGLYRFEADGTTLTFKVDGSQELQTTDSSITIAGFAGFFSSGASATWDDFEAGDIVVGGGDGSLLLLGVGS